MKMAAMVIFQRRFCYNGGFPAMRIEIDEIDEMPGAVTPWTMNGGGILIECEVCAFSANLMQYRPPDPVWEDTTRFGHF